MNFFKNQIFASIISFILGGISTYFVTDYINLKQQKKNVSKEIVKEKNNDIDPFNQMDQMHDEMLKRANRIFNSSLMGDSFFGNFSNGDINVSEEEDKENKYIIVDAEGIDKESLKINIKNSMVSISGEIKKTNFVSKFSRSFNIPYGVSEENVKITSEEGKVIIKFPKIKT